MGLNVGDQLPLRLQVPTYDPALYVRAFVTDPLGNAIVGSPFNLTPDGSTGLYKNTAGVMPNQPFVSCDVLVYSDSGYSVLSDTVGGTNFIFYRNVTPGTTPYLPPTSNIIGVVESDACERGFIEDTIIQGSSRLLTIRLLQEAGGAPFDLTDATEIVFRMRKTDGTVLEVTNEDQIEILNAGGGQIVVTLSADQTAELAPAIPAPATIKVTIDSKVTIVNMASQIAVEEASIEEA